VKFEVGQFIWIVPVPGTKTGVVANEVKLFNKNVPPALISIVPVEPALKFTSPVTVN
jgi:hypothetical protein